MSSTACTDCTRSRNLLSMVGLVPVVSGLIAASHAGCVGLARSNDGVRGAFSPLKVPLSRGAGVDGPCGANVATSRRMA